MDNRQIILRLIDLDTQLATADGIRVTEFAARHGVDVKTIRRDLVMLKELGFTTIVVTEGGRGNGSVYRHRYEDRKRRLFSKAAASIPGSKMVAN